MVGEISGTLPPVVQAISPAETRESGAAGGSAFASLIDAVQSTESSANQAVSGMLDGSVDVHDAMIALQRADMTMELSVQIRNKLVSAYQEIMRMPV